MTEDFYPPRAPEGAWFRGLETAFRRLSRPLRERFSKAGLPGWLRGHPFMAGLLSVVPGLGHLYAEGRPLKPLAFFCVFFLLCGWAVLFGPERFSWLVAALPLSFHNWLVMDSYSRTLAAAGLPRLSGWQQVKASFLWTLLLVLLYSAAIASARRHGTIIRLETGAFAPNLNRGDRLLIRRQKSFQRGDIVYSPYRDGLERVVALPGETVAIDATGVFIDGRPLPAAYYPLSRGVIGDERIFGAKAQAPEDAYCVLFPSQFGDADYLRRQGMNAANYWLQQFFTREDRIAGKVVLRYSPDFRRFD